LSPCLRAWDQNYCRLQDTEQVEPLLFISHSSNHDQNHRFQSVTDHGVLLFLYWVNASDYKDTNESFDLVAFQSTELHEAVNGIILDDTNVLDELSSELTFIAKGYGCSIAFLTCA
jgi:hypothetical protein